MITIENATHSTYFIRKKNAVFFLTNILSFQCINVENYYRVTWKSGTTVLTPKLN